jgi:hypothetical protein
MRSIHQVSRRAYPIAGLALLALLSGCAVIPGESMIPPHRQVASRHHYYGVPKTPDLESGRVLGVPKVNPKWWFENSDEPLPWWWKYGEPEDERKRTWLMRNPLHNFTNYVIGVADRHTHRIGINAHSVWNDKGPVNLAVTRAGYLIYLPMLSGRGRWLEGYFGWRTSGSFGVALRPAQHDSDGTGPRGSSPLSKALAARAREEEAARSDTAARSEQPPVSTGAQRLPPVDTP